MTGVSIGAGNHSLKYLDSSDNDKSRQNTNILRDISTSKRDSKSSSTTSKRYENQKNKKQIFEHTDDEDDTEEKFDVINDDLAWTKYELRISKGGYENLTDNELETMIFAENVTDDELASMLLNKSSDSTIERHTIMKKINEIKQKSNRKNMF